MFLPREIAAISAEQRIGKVTRLLLSVGTVQVIRCAQRRNGAPRIYQIAYMGDGINQRWIIDFFKPARAIRMCVRMKLQLC
jgi:hypothetical protein